MTGRPSAPSSSRPVSTPSSWRARSRRRASSVISSAKARTASSLSDRQLIEYVRALPEDDRAALIRSYVGDRSNRRHKPGRAMERAGYRFDVLSDYGVFRDLQRHRMLTLEWQRLSPTHGYVTPESIDDIDAGATWSEAMDRTTELHARLLDVHGPNVAQYAVPFAFRIRYYMDMNAREAFHLIELRSQQAGHPDYRAIARRMHELIRDEAGHHLIADAMTYVDHRDYDLVSYGADNVEGGEGNDLDIVSWKNIEKE